MVVSEKALAIATGQIVNEANAIPSRNAKFVANFWMRKIWGYPLGILCGLVNAYWQDFGIILWSLEVDINN